MKRLKKYISWLYRIAGAFVMAFSVNSILEPCGLVAGGFTGISIIFKEWLNIPIWITNIVLNIPVFAIAFKWLGKKVMTASLITSLAFSVFVGILPEWTFLEGDIFLSSILGGLLMGAGLGTILYTGVSSGGVDLISLLVHHKKRKMSVTWVMFVLDGIIITVGGVIFGWRSAIYATISVWLVSYVSEKIISGPNYTKACIVVSNANDIIAKRIMEEIKRGITGLYGVGMYTKTENKVLYCVASRHEMSLIRKIVYEEDKKAFMSMFDVSEVIGEGFVDW